jgi:hypothetical protein
MAIWQPVAFGAGKNSHHGLKCISRLGYYMVPKCETAIILDLYENMRFQIKIIASPKIIIDYIVERIFHHGLYNIKVSVSLDNFFYT